MFIPALIGISIAQVPKTFEDVEIEKIRAYVGLKTFREEMHISMRPGDPRGDFVRLIEIDSPMSRSIILMPDLTRFQAVCDGKTRWTIQHAAKEYTEGSVDSGKPFKPSEHLANAEEVDSFEIEFSSGDQPIRFAASPNFKLGAMTEEHVAGERERKVLATATKADKTQIRLTQWFLADKWILKRFRLEKGVELLAEGKCKKLELNAKFEPSYFVMNPALIQGYKKIEGRTK